MTCTSEITRVVYEAFYNLGFLLVPGSDPVLIEIWIRCETNNEHSALLRESRRKKGKWNFRTRELSFPLFHKWNEIFPWNVRPLELSFPKAACTTEIRVR